MLDPNGLIGRSLHDYVPVRLLGSGGFGWVYRVRHPFLGDRALKILYPWLARDREQQERFKQEAITGDHLHHENIVPIHDMFETESLLCIVMKLIDPPNTLAGLLRAGSPLGVEAAIGVARQVAAALDHAHQNGVIHRDVTPNNILTRDGQRFLLGDFGIARLVATGPAAHSRHVVGTPAYMSPEHLSGGDVERRSDIYQFGLVLHQVVTGWVRSSPLEPVPPASSVNPSLPPGLDAVLEGALAPKPDDRPKTAGDLAQAVASQLTAGRTITVQIDSPKPRPWSPILVPPVVRRVHLPARKWALRLSSLGALLAIIVSGASWAVLRSTNSPGHNLAASSSAAASPIAVLPAQLVSPSPTPTSTPAPTPTPSPTATPAPVAVSAPPSSRPATTPIPLPPQPTPLPPTPTPTPIQPAFNGSLVNFHSDMCVDVPNGSTDDSLRLQQWGCNGSGAQLWKATSLGNSTTWLIVNQNSGKCMDVQLGLTSNGTSVQQFSCNGGGAQQWTQVFASPNSAFFALENLQSGRCLDVPNGQTSAGVQLQIWDCNHTVAQTWSVH